MDGLDFITALMGHSAIKNATLKIDGRPHNFGHKKPLNFSAWIHGFTGTDTASIDGTIRFAEHTGGGGVRIDRGVATPIAPAGRPPIATDRLCVSTPLDPKVRAWVKSQGPIAAFVRGLVEAAYQEHLESLNTENKEKRR